MKLWSKAISIVLGACALFVFSSCGTLSPRETPYFGIDDHNKRFVPREVQEDLNEDY